MPERLERLVTQEMIDRYGRINGDNDIIHYDAEYAKNRGFRGTLAHGMMVMAYVGELGARRHGAAWFSCGKLSVKWTAPVCPGDNLSITVSEAGDVKGTVAEGVVVVGSIGGENTIDDGGDES